MLVLEQLLILRLQLFLYRRKLFLDLGQLFFFLLFPFLFVLQQALLQQFLFLVICQVARPDLAQLLVQVLDPLVQALRLLLLRLYLLRLLPDSLSGFGRFGILAGLVHEPFHEVLRFLIDLLGIFFFF